MARLEALAISTSLLRISTATTRYTSPTLPRGDTGRLNVFSLVPETAGKPSFHSRVDDGSSGKRREPELDIDIEGVSNRIARDFKACRNGYIGHHNDRSPSPDHRIFDVEIATPAGKVFEGTVAFNATFSTEIREAIQMK